ncbi:hypothetical protein [Anaeromyxobacter paludicola]|uniref:Uncharacterized protein n=1 Tax=Anaeromyxobacter paludicola TaxID=2918171 RepID=A0ABM7XC01_9BACT|nr:hypothetical protein [Anaeromyxobacter paludicola]BDG09393.1 hypothetical protein AMPC_25060 [Anaeromyxobacter paludicola]
MTPRDLTYKLYIGRSGGGDAARARLLALLQARPGFRFLDLSLAPEASAAEVRRRMRAADAVLLLLAKDAGEERELALARALGRPVIGVSPAGERAAPPAVRRLADEVVGMDAELVVDSIRQYALPS